MVGHEGEREREGGMKKIYLFCLWSWDGLHREKLNYLNYICDRYPLNQQVELIDRSPSSELKSFSCMPEDIELSSSRPSHIQRPFWV